MVNEMLIENRISKIIIRSIRHLIDSKKERKMASRREHNDILYYLRHGRAPVFTHPDDLVE